MDTDFRPLKTGEREILGKLLEAEFPGRDELRAQLNSVTAKQIEEDGTLMLRCASGPPSPSKYRLAIEGMYKDSDGGTIAVFASYRPARFYADARDHTVSYTGYDNVGNRTLMTSTLSAVPGGSFSYDNNDRLSVDTYDNNGNTTSSGGITNAYDFENRMTAHGSVTIVYDGDGNRVSETAGGVTTKYLVDDRNSTGLPQVLDEKVSGSVTRTYAYGLQRISENQLVSGTWKPSFYGYDGHGNVRLLENTAGAVTDTYQYDAFGMPIASSGTTSNTFQYSGERFDSSIGLYDLRARYYNQATGRFWARDPVEGKKCCGLSWNPYIYTANNPVNRIDPSGRSFLEENVFTSDFLLSTFLNLSHAARIAYVDPLFCTNLAALWAVENPSATVAEIVAYEAACLSYLALAP